VSTITVHEESAIVQRLVALILLGAVMDAVNGDCGEFDEGEEMSEWHQGVLSDVTEIVMGQSPAGENCNSNGNGIPLLNGPTEFGVRFPAPVQFTTDPKRISKVNDILFCVRGSTTGRMNWADQKYALGRGLAAIHHKYGEEYRYFVKGIVDFNLSLLLASATGSTFPNISRDQLNELEIVLPPLPEQKAIASVLSSLDDKIDLLNRQNAILEAIAETLFRQWFVEEAQSNGVGKISDLIEFNPKRQLSKGTTAPYLEMANLSTTVFHPDNWYDREFSSGTKMANQLMFRFLRKIKLVGIRQNTL
jgi:restriction endonuclease S subunit